MGYTKQGFAPGMVLTDEHLINIENGIIDTKLKNLRFSIIGDSISTFKEYIPSSYPSFYPKGELTKVNQTWWKILESESGMILNSNASWSGGKCSGDSSSTTNGAAGCSTKRINDLANNGVAPDIVICFVGINDFRINNVDTPIGNWDSSKEIPSDSTNISTFSEAYAIMVDKIMKTYPHARVFCCTLLLTGKSTKDYDNPGKYPIKNESGVVLEEYNKVIRDVANGLGADVIELTKCGLHFYNFQDYTVVDPSSDNGIEGSIYDVDFLHPNIEGHKLVASKMLTELLSKY